MINVGFSHVDFAYCTSLLATGSRYNRSHCCATELLVVLYCYVSVLLLAVRSCCNNIFVSGNLYF